jgi:hypothetical protein
MNSLQDEGIQRLQVQFSGCCFSPCYRTKTRMIESEASITQPQHPINFCNGFVRDGSAGTAA